MRHKIPKQSKPGETPLARLRWWHERVCELELRLEKARAEKEKALQDVIRETKALPDF